MAASTWTPEDRALARRMAARGASVASIARSLNRDPRVVHYWIERDMRRGGKESVAPTPRACIGLYCSAKPLAERMFCHVDPPAIRKICPACTHRMQDESVSYSMEYAA